MGFRTITYHSAQTEIDLDHVQECEYCNYITSVVDRIYGLDVRELNRITENNDAIIQKTNDTSQAIAAEKYADHIKWHRCAGCGKYSTKDMALMRQGLPGLKSWRNRVKWTWWSFGIIFLIIALGSIADAFNPNAGARAAAPALAMVFGILSFLFAYLGKNAASNIDERFGTLMTKVNSKETVQKWLTDWQNESPGMIEKFYNGDPNGFYDINDPNSQMQYRADHYGNIERLQHRYDPIPRDWIPSSAKKTS